MAVKERKITETEAENMGINANPDIELPGHGPDEAGNQTETSANQSPEAAETPQSTEDIQFQALPPEGMDPVLLLQEKLKSAETELHEATDRALRISAEFDNFKKRMNREMDEFRKFANESLIKQLLNVVDNLERAIASSKSGDKANGSIVEGVEMIRKDIMNILEKYNVCPVDCMEKPFDPLYHQAVGQEETDQHPENTVTKELMRGYTLHERLLRPAMVMVSKSKANNKKTTNNDKKINEKA